MISSHFNYLYNRYVVFRDRTRLSKRHHSYYGYFGLVLVILSASYALTEGCSALLDVKGVAITVVKIVADVVLFLVSYLVQKKFIFKSK